MNTITHKLSKTATTLVLTAILGSSSLAFAKDAGQGPQQGKNRLERICKKLACSAKQSEDLRKISQSMAEKRNAEGPQINQLKKQIADEFRKPTPNKTELNRLFSELDRHHDTMKLRVQETMLEVHKILTPTQRNQLADMIERRGVGGLFGRGHHKDHRPKGAGKQPV